MVVLTSDVVYNRLQDIKNPTQEAIETMSLWIMHYKDKTSIDLIVDGWLNCFQTAGTDSKRIALFYVMNDVVQKAKAKHSDALIPAFQPAVLTAVSIGRKQDKVKDVMKRCIQIFKSRNVFSPASTTAMENLLDEGYDAEDQALEVDADDLIKKITNFVSARNIISDMMKCVNEGDFDYKEQCRSGMKDREEGAHILQEVHEAIDTMVQVRHSMEDQKKKMMALSETLELAKRVFQHQKREVLVVEEAYVNFRDGIKAVHAELSEMMEKGVYPGVFSPAADEDQHSLYMNRQQSGWGDNRNQVDMEMDEDERPQAPMMKPHLQALVGISSQPSLQSRIMQLGLKKIADGDEDMFHQDATLAPSDDSKKSVPATIQGTLAQAPVPMTQFSMPPPSIPAAAPPDPRLRASGEGQSQYALALQKHGLPPPGQQQKQVSTAPQPPLQQSTYQAHFEQRDPRFAAVNQPPPTQLTQVPQPSSSGYQAQFEQRDPRMVHQNVPPPTQQAYASTYEAQKPPLLSPQLQGGAYQARFEPSPISPQMMGQQPGTQYQQNQYQQAAGFSRPPPPPSQQQQPVHQQPQRAYTDYHAGGGDRRDDRYDRRDDRGRGSYDDRGRNNYDDRRGHDYDDRRKSAPYNSHRGGGDRWRNGGGYNDRSRSDRDWRGGNRGGGGGYNRY